MKIILGFIKILFLPIKILNRIIYGNGRPNIIGHAWYSQEEYKKIVEDSDDDLNLLIANYKKWEEKARNKTTELQESGNIVFKVNVEKEELDAWLRIEKLPNTSENREKYVLHRLHDFLEKGMIS